jgi:hypothetical protein
VPHGEEEEGEGVATHTLKEGGGGLGGQQWRTSDRGVAAVRRAGRVSRGAWRGARYGEMTGGLEDVGRLWGKENGLDLRRTMTFSIYLKYFKKDLN